MTYLDRGLDLPSDPDASLPLLLVPKNDEVFSFPSDGLGTLPLPVQLKITTRMENKILL